ncbi:protein phosphatase 1 regulatory subunit 17 [Sorex fumeus]|uniref:protein phosphatase 1 regulatory subunit 17 n=1 Tax=Sorex fumeus TaxID=62283 RepID=UPI0024AD6F58|nr:protein phosphatase 1 regulatory subunit 17 [Sorex fumeus]
MLLGDHLSQQEDQAHSKPHVNVSNCHYHSYSYHDTTLNGGRENWSRAARATAAEEPAQPRSKRTLPAPVFSTPHLNTLCWGRNHLLVMSTEKMEPLELSEDRLDQLDPRCSHLDDLSDQFIKDCDLKTRKGKNGQVTLNVESDKKKPRRKDTPALHIPPFIPGVFSEQLIRRYDVQERYPKDKNPALHNTDLEQKKPRRKDTPALHVSPFVGGVTLLRDERPKVIMEDEEKDSDKIPI